MWGSAPAPPRPAAGGPRGAWGDPPPAAGDPWRAAARLCPCSRQTTPRWPGTQLALSAWGAGERWPCAWASAGLQKAAQQRQHGLCRAAGDGDIGYACGCVELQGMHAQGGQSSSDMRHGVLARSVENGSGWRAPSLGGWHCMYMYRCTWGLHMSKPVQWQTCTGKHVHVHVCPRRVSHMDRPVTSVLNQCLRLYASTSQTRRHGPGLRLEPVFFGVGRNAATAFLWKSSRSSSCASAWPRGRPVALVGLTCMYAGESARLAGEGAARALCCPCYVGRGQDDGLQSTAYCGIGDCCSLGLHRWE